MSAECTCQGTVVLRVFIGVSDLIDGRCFIRTLAAVAAIPKPQIYAQPVGYRWASVPPFST